MFKLIFLLFTPTLFFQSQAYEVCDFNSAYIFSDIHSIVQNTRTELCTLSLTNIGEYQAGIKCPLSVERVERLGVVVSPKLCKKFKTQFDEGQKSFQAFIQSYQDFIVISDDDYFSSRKN